MNPRRALLAALLLAVLFAAAILAWRFRAAETRRDAEAATRESSAAARVAAPAKSPGVPAEEDESPGAEAPGEHRRGLWRLSTEEAARLGGVAKPHPWAKYLELREKVLAEWAGRSLEPKPGATPIADLPGIVGAATGLALGIDPALTGHDPLELGAAGTALEVMNRLAARNAWTLRIAVGEDGLLWVVPRGTRGQAEPAFALELLEWEKGFVRRQEREAANAVAPPPDDIRLALATRRERVEIVRISAREALRQLEVIFETGFNWPKVNASRDPLGDEVTFVSDAATLEEALTAVLQPSGWVFEFDAGGVELDSNRHEPSAFDLAESKARRAAEAAARDFLVKLDGCPLAAEDLFTEGARQARVALHVDPNLHGAAARWKAVEAEVPLGRILSEVSAGTGAVCELRVETLPALWDEDYNEIVKPGGTIVSLWVFAPSPAAK